MSTTLKKGIRSEINPINSHLPTQHQKPARSLVV